jgi:hypothetical protein
LTAADGPQWGVVIEGAIELTIDGILLELYEVEPGGEWMVG